MNLYYDRNSQAFSLGNDRLTAIPIDADEVVDRFNSKEVTLSKFKASAIRHYQNEIKGVRQ